MRLPCPRSSTRDGKSQTHSSTGALFGRGHIPPRTPTGTWLTARIDRQRGLDGVNVLPRRIEAVVIGAGQAGLTMSWYLGQAGREHVVLARRDRLGGGWQDRWDAFRLVSPNWTASFPGYAYDGDDRDGFMPRDDIARRVARYADVIGAPVHLAPAGSSSSDRANRVSRSRKSSTRPAGASICPSGTVAACHVATGAATSSIGSGACERAAT